MTEMAVVLWYNLRDYQDTHPGSSATTIATNAAAAGLA